MSRVAEELKRKISDRKFAIECLGMEEEIPERREEFHAVGSGEELLQMALENSQEAVNAVVQDGYHVLQSSKSSFWKKIDIFAKRVIRKLIYVCFGFYIKPILNKQTVFNGKTINAVTALQDWCFLKQNEIGTLEAKWKNFEQNNVKIEQRNQQLFSNLEEKVNLLIQKNFKEEQVNKELTEILKQKEDEIGLLKLQIEELERKFLLEFEKNVKEQEDGLFELNKDLSKLEEKLLLRFETIIEEIHNLQDKWIQSIKEQKEENSSIKVDLEKEKQELLLKLEEALQETNKLENKLTQSVKEQKEESFGIKADLGQTKTELLLRLEWATKEISKLENKWTQFAEEYKEERFSFKTNLSEIKQELLWKLEQVVEKQNKWKDTWKEANEVQKEEIALLEDKFSAVEAKVSSEIGEFQKEHSQKEALLEEHITNLYTNHVNDIEHKFNSMASEQKNAISTLNNKITFIEEDGIKELTENKGILSYLKNKFGLYYDLKMIEDAKMDYFDFENHFRGSRTIIKESQRPYVQYFQTNGGAEILDLGCGRGEFLELMYDYGIKAKGVDVYAPFVNYCKERGFEAIQEDALTYLNSLPDASLGGIFMGQVLEHLEIDYLIALIKCIYKKLKSGCYFITETPNPENLSTYCFFYTDLSHIKPVPYLTIKYLLEKEGFESVERYNNNYSKYPIELLTDVENGSENMKLNNILYSYQDYTVIAKK